MTVLSAMQSAAVRLLGQKPDTFFGAAPNLVFQMELTDLVNEVATDIMKSNDWQALTRVHSLTGDGETAAFPLPDDYDRMLVRTELQDPTNWAWGYAQAADINTFLALEARDFNATPGAWIIYGDEMRFSPAPAGDAQYPYVSKYYARDTATLQTKAAFTADADECLLPERLLTLGLVWRWRENKKLDYSGDQEAFTKAIGEYAAKDKGSRSFRRSGGRSMRGTYPAWPGTLG